VLLQDPLVPLNLRLERLVSLVLLLHLANLCIQVPLRLRELCLIGFNQALLLRNFCRLAAARLRLELLCIELDVVGLQLVGHGL